MTKINLKINTDIGLLDLGEPVNITHTLTDDEDWVLDLGLADLKEKFFIEHKEKYAEKYTGYEWIERCGDFQYRYTVEYKNQPIRSHIDKDENTVFIETDGMEEPHSSGLNDTLSESARSNELAELTKSAR